MRLHPIAWIAWGLAALATALTQRNPYIQVLLLITLVNAWLLLRQHGSASYWKLGLALAVLPVVFSLTFSRFGSHVLFSLPAIPIIGGPWTLEALVFGATSGMALLLTVAVFAMLQVGMRSADVLALLPGPLYRAGSVVALALAFAPQTAMSLQSIAEARRLRGKPVGWRGAPALLLPLLLSTLERALQYAESLDARGFGSRRRSRYRPLRWGLRDTLLVLSAVIAGAGLLLAPAPTYNAYLQLDPVFPSATSIACFAALAMPVLLLLPLGSPHAADHD